MITAEEIIEKFYEMSRELERDGHTPTWTAQDIAVVILNMMRRDGERQHNDG